MAKEEAAEDGAKAGGEDDAPRQKKQKHPEHVNHERWLVSYADFITLLFAFFTVLFALASSDKSKVKEVENSIRKALEGEAYHAPSDGIFESSDDALHPNPIDFETREGLLDKLEVNRFSKEELLAMKKIITQYDLLGNVHIYEYSEGVQIKIKDNIYFKSNTVEIEDVKMEVYNKMLNLLRENKWSLLIEGHASSEEENPMQLSSLRAQSVAISLLKRGVAPSQVFPLSYGDSRPEVKTEDQNKDEVSKNRRVEFILRKRDLRELGRRVY